MTAASVLALTSCGDYLESDNKSSYDDEVVFSNEPLAENSVLYIYSFFAQTNSHRARYMPYYGMNTDVECYGDMRSPESDEKTSLASYNGFANNSWMGSGSNPNSYTCFFNAIEAANLCISNINKYGNPDANAGMAELLGEALTLRAQYYYDLIRAWGDVPARFEPVEKSTIYLPKDDRDSIYKRIISDLKLAAGYLNWTGQSERTKTIERVNKAFALSLRARLILMARGYSQRPKRLDDPTNYEIRRSNDSYLTGNELLQEAYDDLQNVMEHSGFTLASSYDDIFMDLCNDVVTIGRESMFEIPFASSRGRFFNHFAVYHKNKSPKLNSTEKGGQNIVTPTLYWDYSPSDSRRDVNCAPYKWDTDSDPNGYTTKNIGSSVTQQPSFNWGKYDYEHMSRIVSSSDDGVNLIVIRYADVLLMAAETANELGDQSAAKELLKQIRKRAFDPSTWDENVISYIDGITTKENILEAIQEERKFEFPGEMLRRQDLIRWNILGSKVKETVEKMKRLKSRTGEYADVPKESWYRNVDGKCEVYGLSRGETARPEGEGWTETGYDFPAAIVNDNMINNYYINDPDSRQYWPIFQTDIDSSNGKLMNNYGYK